MSHIIDLMQAVNLATNEIEKASRKHPNWPTDPVHAVAVIGEELGELNQAILQTIYEPHKSTKEDVKAEAIQVAAMALRFLMSIEQYEYNRCKQHRQE